MSFHSNNHKSPTSWTEEFIILQSLLCLVLCALSYGGKAAWAPYLLFIVAAFALVPVGYSWEDPSLRHIKSKRRLLPFIPFAIFGLYVAVALLNPSHVPRQSGGWSPRSGWLQWLPTLLDRSLAMEAALPWLASLFQWGAIIYCLNRTRHLRRLNTAIVRFSAGLGVFGCLLAFFGINDVLGVLHVPGATPFASFVYKNAWAAFALLGASMATAAIFHAWDKIPNDNSARVSRYVAFSCFALLLLTLPLSESGTGTLLGTVLLLAVVAVMARRQVIESMGLPTKRQKSGLLLLLLAIGLTGFMGWQSKLVIEREIALQAQRAQGAELVFDSVLGGRPEAISSTLKMISVRPLWGWGPGSFDPVFPLYQSKALASSTGVKLHLDQAHCDWVQLPAELGSVGALCFIAFLLYTVYYILRWGCVNNRWLLLGIGLVLVFALVDFPLQNPGVLLLFFLTLAIAYAEAVNAHQQNDSTRTKQKSTSSQPTVKAAGDHKSRERSSSRSA